MLAPPYRFVQNLLYWHYYTILKGWVAMLCLQAPAKINWTLDILGVRPDGYHLLEMLMQSVDLCDTLCLWEADELTLEGSAQNASVQGEAMASQPVRFDERNLVYRAAQALLAHTGKRLGARMQLTKRIPSGAGLGGGSADAAAALVGLNALWKLNLSREALLGIGLRLGADVPFLLTGGLARVSGIGERMISLSPAPEIWLVITQPCAGLSTAEVFAAYDAGGPLGLRPDNDAAQAALLTGDLLSLGRAMGNVLEPVSRRARPAISEAAGALEREGAVRAMMTGSGSAVFGVFESRALALRAQAALPWPAVLARTLPCNPFSKGL